MMVYSTGNGVHGFTLDPSFGAYVYTHPKMTMPECGPYYSVNEANLASFPEGYHRYLARLREGLDGASIRRGMWALWWPTFIAPCSREASSSIHPRSGIPPASCVLMYEANPIAFLAEQAGGMATDGVNRILTIEPQSLHQRTTFAVGSRQEVTLLQKTLGEA